MTYAAFFFIYVIYSLQVISFCDEEGVRFETGYFLKQWCIVGILPTTTFKIFDKRYMLAANTRWDLVPRRIDRILDKSL
jgi:hypothetical protein